MPTWGDSQRYSIDYSNTMGFRCGFPGDSGAKRLIRTLYDKHRFVMRGNPRLD